MSEVTSPTSARRADPLQAGRDALARHAWQEAFELLSQADREGPLSGADLEALALAAFFAARADLELEVKERAFKAYQSPRATSFGRRISPSTSLASYGYAGKRSIASAWMRRAERLLGWPTATRTPTATSPSSGARRPPWPATSTRRSPSPSGPSRSATGAPTRT